MFTVFDPNGVSRPYSIQAKSPSTALPAVPAVQGVLAVSVEQVADSNRHQKTLNPYIRLDIEQNPRPLLYASDLMSSPVSSLKSTDTVREAQRVFKEKRYRHIPVLNQESKIVGIISDRDLLRFLSVSSKVTGKESIDSIMKSNIISAAPETDIHSVARVMFDEHIGALPIVDEQFSLLGLVTRSDILRGLLKHGPIELWG